MQYARSTEPITQLFASEHVLDEALTKSLELTKSVVALLASNFKGAKTLLLELDMHSYKQQVQRAKDLNAKHAVKAHGYKKLTVRINIELLQFSQILTKEQF